MYRNDEKKKIVKRLDELFNGDPCNGEYKGKKYLFVLKNPKLNLWDTIRDDALKYFEDNKIKWHLGKDNLPNGHLLSSQVACVNHLFILRDNKELVILILKNIDSDIVEAQKMQSGYVEFEYIGSNPLEKGHTRGLI